MHRFFIPPEWIRGDTVFLQDATAHQLRNVLRMQPGARIIVLNNTGAEYEIELTVVEKAEVRGDVIAKRPAAGEPTAAITLYQCLLKKDNFEWVLQKCTEIGVSRFVPVISQRTVVQSVKDNKIARWERIITEAAEQSGRGRVPDLTDPVEFAQAITEAATYDRALIPWEEASARTLRDVHLPGKKRIALFIGSEGGFEAREIAVAADAGAIPVTLGARILRAETAAVVASAITLHEVEQT
ncbi:MAG: 16S rRNA (uracil(1498)-N(3))-methyltransferase [Anaerolineae bacterium]|nr:16S rRNA (uracil(1498)-N(3))-methyltransferase [Anaerolineae bacterium]